MPGTRLTNEDLAVIVDTSDEWITQRTGIRARHIANEGCVCKSCMHALDMSEPSMWFRGAKILTIAMFEPISPGLSAKGSCTLLYTGASMQGIAHITRHGSGSKGA